MADTPLSEQARFALAAFREKTDEPFSAANQAALVSGALADSARRQRNRTRLMIAFAATVAVAALGVALAPHAPSAPVQVAAAEVSPAPGAHWKLEGDTVALASGQVRVAPHSGHRLSVSTSDLQASVQDSAALFEVTEGATSIAVESGDVAWRTGPRNGQLKAGEQASFPSQARPLSLAPVRPLESCQGAAACLATASEGSGLAAELALYQLGTLAHQRSDSAGAQHFFQLYAKRFPDGSFAPEVSIALMLELQAAGNPGAAAKEAERFLARFADDPHAARVRRWAEQIR